MNRSMNERALNKSIENKLQKRWRFYINDPKKEEITEEENLKNAQANPDLNKKREENLKKKKEKEIKKSVDEINIEI